jgi:periplasmic protein CpxP/Spy
MKLMLKTAVIAAGLAVAAWPALRAADESSQPPPPAPPAAPGGENNPEARPPRGPRDPMEQLEHLTQVLGLTQEQHDQIAAIYKANAPQRQAIMSDDSLSPNDKRAKMRELMNGTQAKVRALLTPEQQTKFDAMPRPGRGSRNGGPGRGNPPPPPPGDAPPPPPPSGDAPPPANNPPPPAGGST